MVDKLITISELSKQLNLIDPKSKKPLNYIIRFWETHFRHLDKVNLGIPKHSFDLKTAQI